MQLEQHLRQLVTRKTVGDVESVVEACNFLAQYWAKKQMKPTYQPYYALLEALSYRGLLDECYEVLADMEASGFEVDIGSLNWTLKAAVMGSREEDMLKICRQISEHKDSSTTSDAEREQSTSATAIGEEGVAMPAPPSTRNFSSFTYTCLFQYCAAHDRAEQALIWFTALVNSRSTSVQAFLDLLRPSAVQYLVESLLSVQEYRLAVEIAEWIHVDSGGRLVSPKLWTEIASACAVGDYVS
jgi:pentatricopeptide repeat protein